jgi:hypothetical protein
MTADYALAEPASCGDDTVTCRTVVDSLLSSMGLVIQDGPNPILDENLFDRHDFRRIGIG